MGFLRRKKEQTEEKDETEETEEEKEIRELEERIGKLEKEVFTEEVNDGGEDKPNEDEQNAE